MCYIITLNERGLCELPLQNTVSINGKLGVPCFILLIHCNTDLAHHLNCLSLITARDYVILITPFFVQILPDNEPLGSYSDRYLF